MIRRDRRPSRRPKEILPDLFQLARSDGFAGNVPIEGGLVQRIGGFDDDVVHTAREFGRFDERLKQIVLLDTKVDLSDDDNTVGIEEFQNRADRFLRFRCFCSRLRAEPEAIAASAAVRIFAEKPMKYQTPKRAFRSRRRCIMIRTTYETLPAGRPIARRVRAIA